ncbi:Acid-sensing ion channel 1 [Stylophora pistillata]|uniref:Acid-sensing ion channel 1 n=2 Tax=Stylophora pistillata TaxID=50429 RepID=A0A2B4STJ0_STYPI|nr:Acid-sensing ion channel 1 [Stylophora pistillata]
MKSKIDTADEDENFVKLGLNITGCSDNEFRSARGNLTCGQALLCAYEWYGSAIVRGCNKSVRQNIVNALNRSSERIYNEEEFLARYGHNITGMFLLYCRFMKTTECSDEDFIPRLTESGICYTFNSGQKSPALRAIFEGPDFGLNILLDVQTNESTVADFSHGLKVIVHDQDTFVNRHIGFNIPPGFHATVAVKLRKHIRLPKPYKTNCQQANLPGIGTYTKDGCITQCLANATLARCGCRIIGLQDQSDAPLCSMQDANCVYQSEIDVGEVNLSACSCSNACTELEYETRVSYSKFPDNSIIDILHHTFGKKESSSYMRDNYVFLQVGFQHLAYEKREDVPSYKLESLLGEFGGNMGLFLGCSLLTLCEFLDFVWAAVLSRMRRRSVEISSTEY